MDGGAEGLAHPLLGAEGGAKEAATPATCPTSGSGFCASDSDLEDRPRCRVCHDTDCELIKPCWCVGSVGSICLQCVGQWRSLKDGRLLGTDPGWGAVRCELCGAPWLFEARPRNVADALQVAHRQVLRVGRAWARASTAFGGGNVGLAFGVLQVLFVGYLYLDFVYFVLTRAPLDCVLFFCCLCDLLLSFVGYGLLGGCARTCVFGRDREQEQKELHEGEWRALIPHVEQVQTEPVEEEEWGPEGERKAFWGAVQLILLCLMGVLAQEPWATGPVFIAIKDLVETNGKSDNGHLGTAAYLAACALLGLYAEWRWPPLRLRRNPDGSAIVRARTNAERMETSLAVKAKSSPALQNASPGLLQLPSSPAGP